MPIRNTATLYFATFRLTGGLGEIANEYSQEHHVAIIPRIGDMVKVSPEDEYRKVDGVYWSAGPDPEIEVFLEDDERLADEHIRAAGWKQ